MGQKIHPFGLRLGIIKEHRSRWFADPAHYPALLQEDDFIRTYITKKLSNAGLADIQIERKADQIDLEIRAARPGVVVGRPKPAWDPAKATPSTGFASSSQAASSLKWGEFLKQQPGRRCAWPLTSFPSKLSL
jgi:hypothetical protein